MVFSITYIFDSNVCFQRVLSNTFLTEHHKQIRYQTRSIFRMMSQHHNGTSLDKAVCTQQFLSNFTTFPKNSSLVYVFSYYESEAICFTVALTVIGVLGILENSFLIHATRKKIKFRGPVTDIAGQKKALIYYFIYNLGWAELLTSLACFLVIIELYIDFFQQTLSCRLVRFFEFLFPAISIQLLLVISIDRYSAIVRPFQSININACEKLITAAWLCGFSVSVATIATYDIQLMCLKDNFYTAFYHPDSSVVSSVLSLVVIAFAYFIPGKYALQYFDKIVVRRRRAWQP